MRGLSVGYLKTSQSLEVPLDRLFRSILNNICITLIEEMLGCRSHENISNKKVTDKGQGDKGRGDKGRGNKGVL